jgi:hypothetical protein
MRLRVTFWRSSTHIYASSTPPLHLAKRGVEANFADSRLQIAF